jgi:hypothetical protein
MAVQVNPIKPTLEPPGSKRLKLICDAPLSIVAFNLNLRRYNSARVGAFYEAAGSALEGAGGAAGGGGAVGVDRSREAWNRNGHGGGAGGAAAAAATAAVAGGGLLQSGDAEVAVGPGRWCLPRHSPHLDPPFLFLR